MSNKFELHLSAYAISPDSIVTIESLGFVRDKFANNRYCDTTAYHATYRGATKLPNNDLWQSLKMVLTQDVSFVGILEEEEFFQEELAHYSTDDVTEWEPHYIEKLPFHRPLSNEYKACDIHLNVSLRKSSSATVDYISSIGFASFDKPEVDGDHRIFSATCKSLEGGKKLFEFLNKLLVRIPGVKAKMKFERTTRFIRIPTEAPALPLLSDFDLETWLRCHTAQLDC
ncbi:hypothetical protein MELA_02003 [Candidatus Methylomirabilis lanthanidiphila]|uniref:Uncharacterized protein n=1 Tax=Candidatus Methylomirabilis lanthanidiphila TaxID=2211376 RepID=A0A564ZM28_9BACT|nr:hypothetical protein MELA_02003 [Candidatus Methylomirabilis lanthanidiphila]